MSEFKSVDRMNKINDLIKALQDAKDAEQAAKEIRLQRESELIEAIGNDKVEGSKMEITDRFKVSVSNKLTRTVDLAEYEMLRSDLPEGIQFVEYKPQINMKKFRALEAVDPVLAARLVTSKPSKPSITIKCIEQE